MYMAYRITYAIDTHRDFCVPSKTNSDDTKEVAIFLSCLLTGIEDKLRICENGALKFNFIIMMTLL